MFTRVIIAFILFTIFYCLFTGVMMLLRSQRHGKELFISLTWRVSVAFVLFAILIFAYHMQWLVPYHL